ncbi:hypothetical protein H5410_003520 [Solanum commersonii]|uniref:Uncharacterized protein n=1 Tax=Solanum commersonii TaxID=4109 RepID=A0A9J6B5B3_SOLCO|nr:hypothetical protein H5410_003520 [Solanum commersonii]
MWKEEQVLSVLGREMLPGVARLFSNNLASKRWNNMGKSGLNAKKKLDTSAMKSTTSWDSSKDTGRHTTLHYANLNQMARVWIKIVYSVFLLAKHTSDVTRERVVLVYMLMKAEVIEEEQLDMTVARAPYLICNMVDFMRTKGLNMSHRSVLLAQERQARDDSWLARMFGMTELQLWMGDARLLMMRWRIWRRYVRRFREPLDDDEATADEGMDEEDDDDDANALMRKRKASEDV